MRINENSATPYPLFLPQYGYLPQCGYQRQTNVHTKIDYFIGKKSLMIRKKVPYDKLQNNKNIACG